MADDEGAQRGPWWSRSAWTLGPLAIISIILVLAVVGIVPTFRSNGNGAIARERSFIQHVSTTEELLRVLREFSSAQVQVLKVQRKTCRYVAKTEEQRDKCDE